MYVFWRDPRSAISGWTRIAQQPNQQATSTFACIALPTGTRYRVLDHGSFEAHHRADARWRGNGLEFRWDNEVLRVRYASDDCEYDLSWVGFYDPVDFHAIMATFGRDLGEINAQHVEQSGTVRGTLRVGNETFEIDALGHRDHSWGYRDTSQMLASRWMIGTVGPELSWSGVAVLLATGAFIRTGFVVRDGEVVPVTDLDVTLATKEDGLSYVGADARFELFDGTSLAVELSDVVTGGILEVPPWVGIECGAVATAAGHVGVGNCETSNSITGGSITPPLLVTGGAVGQGLTGPRSAEA
jgi:hypothetical protein